MSNSNGVKAKYLGMPWGTANGRLRKAILFRLVQQTGQDTCYRCDRKIKLEELSIEHKQDWLHVDATLFWALDNIAFSHMKCNRAAMKDPGPKARKCPEGTLWCSICKTFQQIDSFRLAPSAGKRGRAGSCNECKKKEDKRRDRRRSL